MNLLFRLYHSNRKCFQLSIIGLIVLTLELLLATSANAQTGVKVTPNSLTVAGTRGIVETRILLLRTNSSVGDLQITPLDLNRTDGIAILPAGAIRPTLPAQQTKTTNNLLTVPVKFDLRDVPSGEFSGELLVSYQGGELTIPVITRVKDHPVLPFVLLVAGIGLGIVVSNYLAKGRLRDEILVGVGQIRTQLQNDKDLLEKAKPFQSRVETCLRKVTRKLNEEKWEAGRQAVEQAEATLDKWNERRDDWLDLFAYCEEKLHQPIEKLNQQKPGTFIQALRQRLREVWRGAPNLDSPNKFSEELEKLAEQLKHYLQLNAELEKLDEMLTDAELPSEQEEAWSIKVQNWRQELYDLSPFKESEYDELKKKIDEGINELATVVSQSLHPETGTKGRQQPSEPQLVDLPPSSLPLAEDNQVSEAQTRLKWFTRVSYAITVVLLAGVGFSQIYVAQPTFGANAWRDYFALLAWGFGAEATRDAVTKVVRRLDVPGLKEI